MDPSLLRMNLLPPAKATVTSKGIRFKKVFYACERAIKERWFVRARTTGTWKIDIAYDPRSVDFIYLRPDGNTPPEACKLVDPDQRFHGRAWVELHAQAQVQKCKRNSQQRATANPKPIFEQRPTPSSLRPQNRQKPRKQDRAIGLVSLEFAPIGNLSVNMNADSLF